MDPRASFNKPDNFDDRLGEVKRRNAQLNIKAGTLGQLSNEKKAKQIVFDDDMGY